MLVCTMENTEECIEKIRQVFNEAQGSMTLPDFLDFLKRVTVFAEARYFKARSEAQQTKHAE